MTEKLTKRMKLNDLAKAAIEQDKGFLSEMKVRDKKAIILSDGVVVVFEKLKQFSKGSKMEVSSMKSIRIDAILIEDEDREGRFL